METATMSVYIASMNMRGAWAPKPAANLTVINVTSAQGTANKNRRDFSPMTESNYLGTDGVSYYNFEAFWQSGKIYEDIPEAKTKAYWRAVKEPKRRYPGSKLKKVLHAKWENEEMDWVTSRKKVYVPLYHEYMKDKEQALFWKEQVKKGVDVILYDFDGPRLPTGEPTSALVTKELLQEKINDTRFPFGHGYIVAAYLAGIEQEEFI